MANSNWSTFKEYINSKSINDEIKRRTYKTEVPKGLTQPSFDLYCRYLTTLYLLEKIKPGTYKILQHIPKLMNSSVLYMLIDSEKDWQRWFIPIEGRVDNILHKIVQKRVSDISDIK